MNISFLGIYMSEIVFLRIWIVFYKTYAFMLTLNGIAQFRGHLGDNILERI